MKKIILLLIILASTGSVVKSQQDKSPLFKFLHKRGYKFPSDRSEGKSSDWPDTLYYNTIYKAPLLGSPTIPFSFSTVDFNNKGNYSLNSALKLGYGYTWFLGDFTLLENDEISIRQNFSFGVEGDFDFQNSFLTGKPTSSFVAGGFVGLPTFSLFLGYDFIAKSSNFGLITRIDLYTIFQPLLRPFGKVRELRGHIKEAIIVRNNQY